MKQTVDNICKRIMDQGAKFILISGNGASGKSTLANFIKDEYQKFNKTVCIIHTDDFLLDKNYRKNTVKSYVNKAGQTKTGYMASAFPEAYDFAKLTSAIVDKNEDLVIIEGIGAAFLSDYFNQSYKIFLQTDKKTEFSRRQQRARSSADLSEKRMDIRYEQFELFVLPLADQFDLKLISQPDFSYVAT